MDELIAKVAEKTGLPADRARTAIDTVLAFLKSKLPAAIGGQLDQAVGGASTANPADLAKGLGGLFTK